MVTSRGGGAGPRPTARGAGVLVVLVGLVVLSVTTATADLAPLIVALGLPLAAAPFAATVRARRARARLAVNVVVAEPLRVVGSDVSFEIRLTNRTALSAPGLGIVSPVSRWRRPESMAAATAGRRLLVPRGLVALAAPGPHREIVYTAAVPSGRRGVVVLAAQEAWVLDPFGLVGAPGPVVPAVRVVLYPAAAPRVRWPAVTGHERRPGADGGSGSGRDGAGELVGIRPYVAGDRLSLLHWPARARYGSWFVRQFAAESGVEARVILDDRTGVHRQADFEAMLAHAHGLVQLSYEEGRTIALCTLSGEATVLPPVAGALEEARVLLATLLPRSGGRESAAGVGEGTLLTTVTGARSLPETGERIVVGR